MFVDASTPDVFGHWLAIADSNGNSVRTQEIFGSDGSMQFDLGGGGDGDRLDPGTYAVVNANGETDPRALQPLCVQAYSATIRTVTTDPVPGVTVSVSSVVADPPAVGTFGLVLWNGTTDTFVELSAVGDREFEGDLSGVDPGTYSLHALVVDDTVDERLVGLSGTATAEVVTQTGLAFAVDGQADAVTLTEGDTVPYTATAEYEGGGTEDVTDAVSVSVTAGDSGAVGIDETATEITGTGVGTATLEADDGEFTDTVEVTVDPPPQVGLTFEVDGQAGAVTVDDGETVPYTATAEFEGGGTEEVTNEVAVTVTGGDPAVVDIDESATAVTGAEPGTATLEADDDEFTDTVEVTVAAVLTGVVLEIDGQSGSVTIDEGETVPYGVAAEFSDGTETDVTGEASVTSADPGVVSVDQAADEVTGETPGETTTVTADYEAEMDAVDVTIPGGDGTDVTLSAGTIPPAGEASLGIVGSGVETLTVEDLWTDWEVSATDPDGGEVTDGVAATGAFELSWESQQSSVAPTVLVTPPGRYVGGEFELTATAVGGDGSVAVDTAVLTVDGGSD